MIRNQTNEILFKIIRNTTGESRYNASEKTYLKLSLGVGGDGGNISYGKKCLCSMGGILGTVFARWAG